MKIMATWRIHAVNTINYMFNTEANNRDEAITSFAEHREAFWTPIDDDWEFISVKEIVK